MSRRIAVFASGGGSNLQALIDAFNGARDRGARVALVVADRPCGALDRAQRAGIEHTLIDTRALGPDDVAMTTLAALAGARIDLVALAGYLRLIPPAVVERYRGRMTNIHPALLPAFGGAGMYGMRVHRAVIAAGARVSGATVHEVDERYDEGRALAQWPVPVLDDDSPETLAARVLAVEHCLYPLALERLVRVLDGRPVAAVPAFGFGLAASAAETERAMRRACGLPEEE